MNYIATETLAYPLSEQAIRAAHPDHSPPVPFKPPIGYELVFDAPKPTHDAITQVVREVAPVLTDKGHWEQKWEVVPRFETEAEANAAVVADLASKAATLQASVVSNTQKRLDDFAQTRHYDGILSACTYATSAVAQFQAEGQAAVAARDATWAALYQILAQVQTGARPMPSGFADIEPELPALAWPA